MFQPGQILQERYVLRQSLGKKAGRRTLLAHDLQAQSLVVVKLLIFGSDFEWDDLKLFEREAETLKSLDHPLIPRYFDFFDLDLPHHKGFGLVQNYIAAKSLADQIKGGRTFSAAEVKEIAKELLKILMYLHGRQPPVIHRDIKPSNILLGDRSGNNLGSVYLVDFGSVQTTRGAGTITVVGTYGYMPPEQFGDRAVPASDLYALGATLIHLVTGIPPVHPLRNSMSLNLGNSVGLNPRFFNWLASLVEPDLDRRFSSVQQAQQSLEQGSAMIVSGSLNQEVLKNRDLLKVTTKSPQKLEICKQEKPIHNINSGWDTVYFLVSLMIVFALSGLLLFSGRAGMVMFFFFWLAVLIMLGALYVSSPSQSEGVYRYCLEFDAKADRFEIKNDSYTEYNSISSIRYLSIYEINNETYYGSQEKRWAIYIRTYRERHFINWDLPEEESIWLADEIQNWIRHLSSKL
jgi:serine/threonine protein kinase